MAIIEKRVQLEGIKGELKIEALFDSGASYSCIEKELAVRLSVLISLRRPLRFALAEAERSIEAMEKVLLDFYIDGYRFSDEFIVIPNLSEKLIIGTTTMQKWRLKLDFEREEVIIDPKVTKLRLV